MVNNASVTAIFCSFLLSFAQANSQVIDFETLPGGAPTTDNMLINAQYEADFGVRFSLVDPVTGAQAGFPRIAKVGSPVTAFVSCQGDDTPDSGLGTGSSFLTDDGVLGNSSNLLVEYLAPVREASGIILDVDARSSEPGAVEAWKIEAFSNTGVLLDVVQIFAPQGPDEPGCEGFNGEGDGSARGFSFSRAQADIASIQFSYIGNAKLGSVGLAFDNFSPAAAVEELQIEISIDPFNAPQCTGQYATLIVQTSGGFSDQTIRWERRLTPNSDWEATSVDQFNTYYPKNDEELRAVVDDGSDEVASDPITFMLLERGFNLLSDSQDLRDVTAFLFDSVDAQELWGDDPTTFGNDEIETVSEGVHMVPVITANGAHLAVIYNTTGGSSPGSVRTTITTLGWEPSLIFVDDPDDPMYNDTYTEKLLAPGMKRFTLDQTWAGDKTDGFIIGPLNDTGSCTISFTNSIGLSTGLVFNGDGEPIPFNFVDGMVMTFSSSCGGSCPPDLTGDGALDIFDVFAFLNLFAAGDPGADFSGDGTLDVFDVFAFLDLFSTGCP